MPVLSKFDGIVIRLLIDRTFGMCLHAFYGDTELVMGLNPLRVIQSDVPLWVKERALEWAAQYSARFPQSGNIDLSVSTPISRQSIRQCGFYS